MYVYGFMQLDYYSSNTAVFTANIHPIRYVFGCLYLNNFLRKCLPYSVGLKVHVSQQVQSPGPLPTLAGELDPFFWTRWPALGLSPDL